MDRGKIGTLGAVNLIDQKRTLFGFIGELRDDRANYCRMTMDVTFDYNQEIKKVQMRHMTQTNYRGFKESRKGWAHGQGQLFSVF